MKIDEIEGLFDFVAWFINFSIRTRDYQNRFSFDISSTFIL
jgi:hypothetical protein